MNSTGITIQGVQKSYRPGEVIQDKCNPIFQVINMLSSERGKVCDSCFQIVNPKTRVSYVQACSGCKRMYYCSKGCQKADWKNGHKLECKSTTWNKTFEDLDGKDRYFVELRSHLFRTLAFLKFNPTIADKPFTMYDGSTRSFNELLALPEMQEAFTTDLSPKIPDFLTGFAQEILDEKLDTGTIVADTKFFTKLLRIIMGCNAIAERNNTLNGKTVQIGLSLYVQRSDIKHSCKPNAVFCTSPDGNCMQLKAIAPIQEGEKPRMSYIGGDMGKEVRQQMTKVLYNFVCTCDRCTTDEDATVDFARFNSHDDFFKSCTLLNNNWMTVSVGEFFARHEEMVDMMKKMYHEYDEPVSQHYSQVFHALVFTYLDVAEGIMDSPKAKALYEDTNLQILITFGEDHPLYGQLTNTMEMVTQRIKWELFKLMNNPNKRPTLGDVFESNILNYL